MGRYGNGITFKEACSMDREQLVMALDMKTVRDETENGFEYDSCSKEEADQKVLEIFDNLVYQARQSNAVARAQERYLTKKMGKRWMKLFNKGFIKSGYIDKEMLEEFEEEYQKTDPELS